MGSVITAEPSQRETSVPASQLISGSAPKAGGEHGSVVVLPAAV